MSYLTKVEINDLIKKYQSELRKLEYQASKTQITIDELQAMIPMESSDNRYQSSFSSPTASTVHEREEVRSRTTTESGYSELNGKPTQSKVDTIAVKTAPPSPKAKLTKLSTRPGKRIRKQGGYRLSDWDEFLLNTLKQEQRTLMTSDFLDICLEQQKGKANPMSEEEIKGKLSRSIHKLANKRELIEKIQTAGKGYTYALKSWFTAAGSLKSNYL